ncbi:heavy-metal-associated domain-containing protein [archaeon]|nr:heavy-metal-associated domain-containing protein [archaeon]
MKKTLTIGSMHCDGCARTIQNYLKTLDGVKSASASFDSKKLEVDFDEKKTSLQKIIQEIKDLGYSAK